jgi:hypothetical protein
MDNNNLLLTVVTVTCILVLKFEVVSVKSFISEINHCRFFKGFTSLVQYFDRVVIGGAKLSVEA